MYFVTEQLSFKINTLKAASIMYRVLIYSKKLLPVILLYVNHSIHSSWI